MLKASALFLSFAASLTLGTVTAAAADGIDARLDPMWLCQDAVADATTSTTVSQRNDNRSFTVTISLYDAWLRSTTQLAHIEGVALRTRIPGMTTWMPIENYIGQDAVTGDAVDLVLTPNANGDEAEGKLTYTHQGKTKESDVTCSRQ